MCVCVRVCVCVVCVKPLLFVFSTDRLLQCSCHLGLLGKAMEVEPQEVDQLETRFATMSLDSTGTSSGGVGRSVLTDRGAFNLYLMPTQHFKKLSIQIISISEH